MKLIKTLRTFNKQASFHEKKLNMLIFFVTSKCNARCRSCFYWENLNTKGDLTLSEIEKLACTMPRFRDLWLSGGEPTLRKDLAEIVKIFYDNNEVRSVNLPTNGLLPEKSTRYAGRILKENPDLRLNVNVSLDGFQETHDRIRGVRGNFYKTLESIGNLSQLKKEQSCLKVFVNSTICRENYLELIKLGHYILDEFEIDGHYFQIIRGDVMDSDLKSIPPEFLEEFYRKAALIHWLYFPRWNTNQNGQFKGIRKSIYMGAYLFCFWTQWENYIYGKEWDMECTAGDTSAVIDYNGDLRICELREPVGNLRQCNFEFPRLWRSNEKKREIERMKRDRCFCTHPCFIMDSLRHSREAKLFKLARRFWMYKKSIQTPVS